MRAETMKMAKFALAALLIPACAQQIQLPPQVEKLAEKAKESVDVTLDGNMLRLTARMLNSKDEDEAKVKKLLEGLESIGVRSFQFDREGEYDLKDLDAVRAQFASPAWSRIVGVRAKESGDNVDVYFKAGAGGTLAGVGVIAAGPKELTIVHVVGNLDPERLMELGGRFHIPQMEMETRKELRMVP
jgi:hypothetical protein